MLLASIIIIVSAVSVVTGSVVIVVVALRMIHRARIRARLVPERVADRMTSAFLFGVRGDVSILTIAELRRARRQSFYSDDSRTRPLLSELDLDDYLADPIIRRFIDRARRAAASQRAEARHESGLTSQ